MDKDYKAPAKKDEPKTYTVLRGISVGLAWEEGDTLTDDDAPESAIKDWLKIKAIAPVKEGQ